MVKDRAKVPYTSHLWPIFRRPGSTPLSNGHPYGGSKKSLEWATNLEGNFLQGRCELSTGKIAAQPLPPSTQQGGWITVGILVLHSSISAPHGVKPTCSVTHRFCSRAFSFACSPCPCRRVPPENRKGQPVSQYWGRLTAPWAGSCQGWTIPGTPTTPSFLPRFRCWPGQVA